MTEDNRLPGVFWLNFTVAIACVVGAAFSAAEGHAAWAAVAGFLGGANFACALDSLLRRTSAAAGFS